MKLSSVLTEMPIVAILRGVEPHEAVAIAEALYQSGVICVEVPLNSPRPLESIAAIRAAFDGRMLTGAGTVLTPRDVAEVVSAGGEFIVSPNTEVSVIRETKDKGLASLPGFFTPSEAFTALQAGADALKLFPAENAPSAYVRAIKTVLPPQAPLLVVGGVDESKIADYLAAGAIGFGLGSTLYKPGFTAEEVGARTASFVGAFKRARRV